MNFLDQDEYIRLTHTSSEDVFRASSKRHDQDQYIRLGHTSSMRLQDVFKTCLRHLQDVLQRCLQDVFKIFYQVKLFLVTQFQEVFETYSKRF